MATCLSSNVCVGSHTLRNKVFRDNGIIIVVVRLGDVIFQCGFKGEISILMKAEDV